MNRAKSISVSNLNKAVSFFRLWVFNSEMHTQRGEGFIAHSVKSRLARGRFWIGINTFFSSQSSLVTIAIGVKRIHFDIDLIFSARPEEEIRNDRRTNTFKHIDPPFRFESWFLGYEGIGLFRELSVHDDITISRIEVGAHPMITIGFVNLYHPSTQQAIFGVQIINFQISVHSAIDKLSA
jgi:hypothetical protein